VKKPARTASTKDVLFVEHGDDVNDETDDTRDARHDRAQQLEQLGFLHISPPATAQPQLRQRDQAASPSKRCVSDFELIRQTTGGSCRGPR
jgi:hypothetical protein